MLYFDSLNKSGFIRNFRPKRFHKIDSRCAAYVVGKVYHLLFLPHCFLPFLLLKSKKYYPVLANTYFAIPLIFGTFIVWSPLAKLVLRPEAKERKD
jgi:hypothetical protein